MNTDYSADDILKILNESHIPIDKLNACARLIYEWEVDDEPDARLVVVKIAKILTVGRQTGSAGEV